MYKVYCNNVLVHDGSSPSKEIQLVNPKLKLGVNIAGSFTCVIPKSHLAYGMFNLMQDTITIKRDGDIIWKGRPISESRDFWNNRSVTCEGAYAFLNDSVQELYYEENSDPARFIRHLLQIHNGRVQANRGILYGGVTMTDPNVDYIYETTYNSTYEELKTNLLDRIGGIVTIKYRSDGMPLLYYDDVSMVGTLTDQEINFGINLMDFTRNWDLSNLCTVVLPLGAEIKKEPSEEPIDSDTDQDIYEQKEYVTVKDLPDAHGSRFVSVSDEAIQKYGRIERTISFSDIEDPDILFSVAQDYLYNTQFDDMALELRAIDLHFLNPNIPSFDVMDAVRCISKPHGLDRLFPITSIDIALDNPENTIYTLNDTNDKTTISSSTVSMKSSFNKALSKTSSTQNIITSSMDRVKSLLLDYAHITEGVIDNAEINYANVQDLSANYASIVEGKISNATIDYARVNELQNHYAHINNGVIDNARIDSAYIDDLSNRFAHIENGEIDNAKISYAKVKDLETNYAKIEDGYITNATITSAKIDDLDNRFAHISYGVIDNAEINYAKVKELDSHYSKTDFSNVTNSWVERGVIKDGAITSAMILGLSANKITSGTIDASQITVTNLNADNITTGTINGQRIGTGSIALSKLSSEVYTKSEINNIIDDVNDRIDSTIETYTGTAIPLLQNYPASDWTTNDVKDTHVGDVYYLVNPNLPENGYAYRFSKLNNVYSWELISDSDVTAALNDLKNIKDRVGTIENFDTDVSTWRTNVDGNITALTTSHTELNTAVGKTVESMTQLWYAKDDTTLPPAPSTHVTSESVGPKEWTTAIPIFNNENPHYFYCWEYKYKDGTYSVSDPVYDRVMSQSQMEAYGGIIASYQLWTIGPTEDVPDGPTGIGGPYSIVKLLDRDSLLDSNNVPIQDSTGEDYTVNVASQETIDFLKCGNLEYMHDSNGAIINDNVSDPYLTGLRWTIEVPAYDVNNPNYFYCWEYHYLDGTVDWSDGVFDKATTQAQKTSQDTGEELNRKVDITTFNKLQHTTDMNSAEITRMATVITNNEQTTTDTINNITQTATATTNTIKRITQRLKLNEDGSASEEDIVHEYSELSNEVDLFKQTVGRTYYTKEEASNFKIGGRNLLRLTRAFESTSISDELGESIYDSSNRNILTSRSENGYLNNTESILTFDQHMNLSIRMLDLRSSSTNVYAVFAEYSNVIVPVINAEYIFSFYAKGDGKFKVYFTNGSISEVIKTETSQIPGDIDESSDGVAEILVNSLWTRYWVKWIPTGTATNAYRNVVIRVYGGNRIYICGLKFEESSRATDWSPAPEDGEEMIEYTTREFDKIIEERVGQVETDIIKTAESIELKADKNETYTVSDINGIIEETVSSQSSLISQTAGSIISTVSSTYATKSALKGLSDTVGAMSTAIEQTASDIKLKADSSTTYTKKEVDGLISTEIRNRNSAIELSDSGVLTTVEATYATKKDFRNLGIGGRNYLMFTKEFNDAMLTDSEGRNITDSNGVAFGIEDDRYLVVSNSGLVPSDAPDGWTAYKFQDFGTRNLTLQGSEGHTNDYKEFALYKNVIAPIPGQSYVFSFYAKGSGKIDAYFYPNPTGGTCSAVSSQDVENNNSDGHITFTLDDTWTKYWVKWTIGGTNNNNAKRNVLLRMFYGIPENRAIVCALKFEEGTVPTAWSPAIEDAGVTLEEYQQSLLEELRKTGELINEKLIGVGESVVEARSSFHVEADNIRSEVQVKTDARTIVSSINQSADEIKISADKITLDGASTFESFAMKSDIPTKLSQLSNEETDYQTANQISTAIANGTTSFAKKDVAIKSMRLIYYATSANSSAPSLPTNTEVVDTTGSANRWTLIRPTLTSSINKIYASTQTVTAEGKVSWTPVKVDNTTTNFAGTYEAVKESQTIYYASNTDTTPSTQSIANTWVTLTSSTANNQWTRIRPNYNPNYSYVYQATQTKYVNDSVSTSTPSKDNLESTFATKNDAVAEFQYIYKSVSKGTTSVDTPRDWIVKGKNQDGTDVQGEWTTVRPQWDRSYPNLFIAKQEKTLSGKVNTTIPIKDESLTVIDGGYITTGTIDASKINLNTINVTSLGGHEAYATISDVENSISKLNDYVGATQTELLQNGTFTSTDVSGWSVQSGANLAFENGYLKVYSSSTSTSAKYGIYRNVYVDKSDAMYDVTIEVGSSFHVGVSASSTGYPSEVAFSNIGNGKYRYSIRSTNAKVIRIYIYSFGSTAIINGDTFIKSVSVVEQVSYSNTLPLSEQYIYVNRPTGFYVSGPTPPSYWVTNSNPWSRTGSDWTNVRPEYNPDMPILYVAKQTMYLDGSVTSTQSKRDTSLTVIDGGFIRTGQIAAEYIDVNSIKITSLNTEDSNLITDTQTIYFLNILDDNGVYYQDVPNPTDWVVDDFNGSQHWSISKPSRNDHKYSRLYTSIQKIDINGNVTYTTPVDDSSWYSDGNKVSDTSYIYYSAGSQTSASDILMPSDWVTDMTGYQHTWTRVRPKYSRSYPVLFISQQSKLFDGRVRFTEPKIDDTTTVIDGGHITTGEIDCNNVTVKNINASYINTGSLSASLIKTGTLSASLITTGTLEVGDLVFKNNGRHVRSDRVSYIKDLSFEWHTNTELETWYSTAMIDGWETVVKGHDNIYGRRRTTPLVTLGIGFDCEIEYDTLEFNNGLCVDYSAHTYTTEAAFTRYT